MNPDLIDILLATFNGEKYLAEQLNSIIRQSCTNWKLIIRDDGSTDKTLEIIKDYVKKNPVKIILIDDNNGNSGACNNFSRLIGFTGADYIMFCDQDDVWLPDKIELTLAKMKRMESEYGKQTPVLVYTDLKVVGQNLKPLAESFWKYQKIKPAYGKKLNNLLVQNSISGCTVMFNSSLKKLIGNIPPEALMHDWWVALIACVFGKSEYINQATMLYRQHKKNLSNSGQALNFKNRVNKFFRYNSKYQLKKDFQDSQQQARVFLSMYQDKLNKKDLKEIQIFSDLHQLGFFKKRFYMLKYGFLKNNFISNISLFLRL
jgi:glycosyltransferase involved in cell wall biosynthesis